MMEKREKKDRNVKGLKVFKLTPAGPVEVSKSEAIEYSKKSKLSGAHPCPCRSGN